MDPYLSSCLLLMAIMSTLVSYIYGSSVGIQVRKTKIWPSLALEVTLGKFSFSQVKKHISAHNFCNGQKFQCSISGPKYWCAVIWCRVRTSGDRMYLLTLRLFCQNQRYKMNLKLEKLIHFRARLHLVPDTATLQLFAL